MNTSNTSTPRKFLNRAQSAAVRIAAEKRSREFNAALPAKTAIKAKPTKSAHPFTEKQSADLAVFWANLKAQKAQEVAA